VRVDQPDVISPYEGSKRCILTSEQKVELANPRSEAALKGKAWNAIDGGALNPPAPREKGAVTT
jgi:hypothetical protein